MTFARLHRGEWVALVAALCLLLAMSGIWYSTDLGNFAHQVESQATAQQGFPGVVDQNLRDEARRVVLSQQRTAWQPASASDWIVLVALVGVVATAVGASFLRAAGRTGPRGFAPSAIVASAGAICSVFLMAQMADLLISQPGATVQLGAYAGLACAAAVTLGAALALREERSVRAYSARTVEVIQKGSS